MRAKRLVRIFRRFEDSESRGYVLDIGPRFFLFLLVSDRIWFDGFECFRIEDLKKVEAAPYAAFAEAALKKRRQAKPRRPAVRLGRSEELLTSAGRTFPLVSIHCEVVDRNVCWIGCVLSVQGGRVRLRLITPAAEWESKPTFYRLSQITRISFGGDYERALQLVGGPPPRAVRRTGR